MKSIINWLDLLFDLPHFFHGWKTIQDIDPLEERYPEHYLDSSTQIEECTICGLHKRTVYIYDDLDVTYEKPCLGCAKVDCVCRET